MQYVVYENHERNRSRDEVVMFLHSFGRRMMLS